MQWDISVAHGDESCPRLQHQGTFDLGFGFDGGENGLYYNTITWEWRWRRCDYRMH